MAIMILLMNSNYTVRAILLRLIAQSSHSSLEFARDLPLLNETQFLEQQPANYEQVFDAQNLFSNTVISSRFTWIVNTHFP